MRLDRFEIETFGALENFRAENLAGLSLLRRRFPDVPIDCVCVDTLNGRTVVYRSSYAAGLLDLGHRAGEAYVSRLGARA